MNIGVVHLDAALARTSRPGPSAAAAAAATDNDTTTSGGRASSRARSKLTTGSAYECERLVRMYIYIH